MDAVTIPLIALVTLILVKEAGVPVPVPGDLVVIGAGVAASRGDFQPGIAIVAIVAASIVGGIVQYGLLRSVARPLILRLLVRFVAAERLDRQTDAFRRRGAGSVAVARMTPGVRIVAIAASALAGVPAVAFMAGLAIGNALFIAAHFALGYVLGEPVLTVVGGTLGIVAIVGIGLAVVGGIGWFALVRRRGRGRKTAASSIGAWADACCPACLTLAALERARGVA
jgi:membrane-associated protein